MKAGSLRWFSQVINPIPLIYIYKNILLFYYQEDITPFIINMSKLKTKKGASKRFRLTASGKVKSYQSGKKHGMIKRTNPQIRNQRGSTILSDQDARIVKKFLPYG